MNIPECCDQPMLVRADGVFECDVCAEEMTVSQYENACESAYLRQQERLMSDPPESYEGIQARNRRDKDGFR